MKTVTEIFQELDADPANATLTRLVNGVAVEMSVQERQSVLEEQAQSIFDQNNVKWLNAQTFMAAFSLQEKAAISLSTDLTVAALRFELSAWANSVYLNDARVQAGLDKLVELGVITLERRTAIEATAQ